MKAVGAVLDFQDSVLYNELISISKGDCGMMRLSAFAKRVYRRFFINSNHKILWQITDKLVHLRKDAAALSVKLASVERNNAKITEHNLQELQSALSEVCAQVLELCKGQQELKQLSREKLAELDNHSEQRLAELRSTTEKKFSELSSLTEKHLSDFKAQIETQFVEMKESMKQLYHTTIINQHKSESEHSGRQDVSLNNIKLSVIIPVFNVERYLAECLDSVVSQDFDNFEVLCVDDGSTDRSGAILDSYARKYPFVYAFHTANQGLGAARNFGLRHASGDYVYFIDSDDTVRQGAFSYLCNETQSLDLDILYFDGEAFYENQEMKRLYPQFTTTYSYSRSQEYRTICAGQEMFCLMKHNGDHRVNSALQILKRSFLQKQGIFFPEKILYEDNIFDFDCFTRAKRVSHRQRVFYNRRVRPGSIMTSLPTEFNVYSSFRCYIELSQRLLSLQVSPAVSELMKSTLKHFSSDTLKQFQLIAKPLDSYTSFFTPSTRMLFKKMILDQSE